MLELEAAAGPDKGTAAGAPLSDFGGQRFICAAVALTLQEAKASHKHEHERGDDDDDDDEEEEEEGVDERCSEVVRRARGVPAKAPSLLIASYSIRPPPSLLAPAATTSARVTWLGRCASASAARRARAAFTAASGMCTNVSLQAGARRRTYVAPSHVPGAGWGLFLDERPAAAGSYLTEYVAEVVSASESLRRGAIYDIFNRSYILALTAEADLDATALGNKARFINHSSRPNARAATVVAGGARRVALFATRAIAPGEEITFDYGYGTAVDWQSDFHLSGRAKSSADTAKAIASAIATAAGSDGVESASTPTASGVNAKWQPGVKR